MSIMELLFFATCLAVYATMVPDITDRRLRLSVVRVSGDGGSFVERDGAAAMKPIV